MYCITEIKSYVLYNRDIHSLLIFVPLGVLIRGRFKDFAYTKHVSLNQRVISKDYLPYI